MIVKPTSKIKTPTKIKDVKLFWDLDGTVSNSLSQNHRTTVKTARFFGLYEPSIEEIQTNFDPSGEFKEFHRIIGVSEELIVKKLGERYSIYGKKWMEIYSQELEDNPPELSPGISSLIENLSALGVHQYICTLAPRDHAEKQLGGLQKHFKDIVNVEGTKLLALTSLREQMGNDPLVHIGDTVYDGRSTVSAGIVFGAILHSCAYNTIHALRKFVALNDRMAFSINGFENFEEDLSQVEFNEN